MSNSEKDAFINGIELAIDYGINIPYEEYLFYCLLINERKGEVV